MDFNTNLKIGVVFGVPVKYTRLRSAWEVKPKRVDKDLEMTEEDFLQISFFFFKILILGFISLGLKGC